MISICSLMTIGQTSLSSRLVWARQRQFIAVNIRENQRSTAARGGGRFQVPMALMDGAQATPKEQAEMRRRQQR